MSALICVQSLCLGVGQKVNPLDNRSTSSSVRSTLERIMTVDVSKRIEAFLLA